jgi:hypothetical protein
MHLEAELKVQLEEGRAAPDPGAERRINMNKRLAGIVSLLVLLGGALPAYGSNPGEGRWVAEQVFRGTNARGMTGLIVTNSAYTTRRGNLVLGLGGVTDTTAGVSSTTVPLTATYGWSDSVEFGVAASYVSTAAATGLGDTEINWKWRFRNQGEYLPAMGLALGLIAPTGAAGLKTVQNWGAKLNLMASSESALTETFYIGMYLDGEVGQLDPGAAAAESYTALNAGVLFPISDDNRLQLLAESNSVAGRAAAANNYTAITAGLRYASDGFKFTLGGQSLSRSDSTTSSRMYVNVGVEF